MYQAKIIEENEFDLWDNFVDNSPWSDILQMSGWAKTKQEEGWKSLIIGVYSSAILAVPSSNTTTALKTPKLVLGAQILYKSAGFIGNYAYVPHGLVFHTKTDLEDGLEAFLNFFQSIAPQYNFFSLEIEPKIGNLATDQEILPDSSLSVHLDSDILKYYTKLNFVITGRNMQPKYKLLYDLNESEETLLGHCQKTTRYNIRLAEKKGVEVNFYYPDDAEINEKLEIFYNLMLETQQRTDGYPIRSLDSFKKLFQSFRGTKRIALFESSFEGQVLAMNISERTKFWSSSFYAGSSRSHSELKPTYALRWKSVMEAKQYCSKTYDFWGIIPNSSQHSGYSSNKLSFGGTRIDYVGLLAFTVVPWKQTIWDLGIRFRTNWKSALRGLFYKLIGKKA